MRKLKVAKIKEYKERVKEKFVPKVDDEKRK